MRDDQHEPGGGCSLGHPYRRIHHHPAGPGVSLSSSRLRHKGGNGFSSLSWRKGRTLKGGKEETGHLGEKGLLSRFPSEMESG